MPKSTVIEQLINGHSLVSDQVDVTELRVILRELQKQLEVNEVAAVVEFGCYVGTTSLFIRRLLDTYRSAAEFHVYDSFNGLPEKTSHDLSPAGEQFKTGELAVSRKAFEMQFKKAGLKSPKIHKGWFSDFNDRDVPDMISFAYLDGDYYESIGDSLRLIETKLAPGAIIVVDDYANEALPGAARAVDEWRISHPSSLRVESSLALMTMLT